MQITYEQYQNQVGRARETRRGARGRRERSAPLGRAEVRRLTQLGISLALFFAVFLGKGVFPAQLEQLEALLGASADLKGAFSRLGNAISAGEPVPRAVGDWCAAVFAPGQVVRVTTKEPWKHSPLLERERQLQAAGEMPARQRLAHRLMEQLDAPASAALPLTEPIRFAGAVHRAARAEERAGETADASPALPEQGAAEHTSLGLAHTVTPVLGVLTSGYGYREHPIDGAYKFHAGVDLAADKHTDILAFADGVVDFVGKSDAYGNYVQLRHAGGVTSFYAHCDELLLPKGTQVSAGDVIARVGETGNATGPHLHLELRVNGELTDPTAHIETLG